MLHFYVNPGKLKQNRGTASFNDDISPGKLAVGHLFETGFKYAEYETPCPRQPFGEHHQKIILKYSCTAYPFLTSNCEHRSVCQHPTSD